MVELEITTGVPAVAASDVEPSTRPAAQPNGTLEFWDQLGEPRFVLLVMSGKLVTP